jgi:hypothetical protein
MVTEHSRWSFIKLLRGMRIFLSAFLRSNLLVTTSLIAEHFREASRLDIEIVFTAYSDRKIL